MDVTLYICTHLFQPWISSASGGVESPFNILSWKLIDSLFNLSCGLFLLAWLLASLLADWLFGSEEDNLFCNFLMTLFFPRCLRVSVSVNLSVPWGIFQQAAAAASTCILFLCCWKTNEFSLQRQDFTNRFLWFSIHITGIFITQTKKDIINAESGPTTPFYLWDVWAELCWSHQDFHTITASQWRDF